MLTSGGAGVAPTFEDAGGGGLRSVQVITANGTWTKPAGINLVKVYVTGGGGGGGDGSAANNPSCGGGGGGTSIKFIDVSAISSETVTIGAGGAGGTGGGTGSSGGTSSFGAHCSATGGTGGAANNSNSFGVGGVGASGDLNLKGGDGGSWKGSTRTRHQRRRWFILATNTKPRQRWRWL